MNDDRCCTCAWLAAGTKTLWPFLIAMQAIPALTSLILTPFLPETPRFLMIMKQKEEAAEKCMWCPSVVDICTVHCLTLWCLGVTVYHPIATVKRLKRLKLDKFLMGNPTIELGLCGVTSHVGLHCVTVVLSPDTSEHSPSQPVRPVLDLPTLEGWKAELT